MLNIPEAVKNLYKEETTESIRKNLRITFPDGQLSDDFPNGITCANIVAESMRFTESVCSQDNFKFGTSEAPVIEFETVGVPNILGYRIQAWLEIETTTVSDDLTGDYDGEFIALADSDLGFPFYRLPLGVFTVQSCPRSHGAMTHRQITAYGRSAFDLTTPDRFTAWKLSRFYPPSAAPSFGENFFAPSYYGENYQRSQAAYNSGTLVNYETSQKSHGHITIRMRNDHQIQIARGTISWRSYAENEFSSRGANGQTLYRLKIDNFKSGADIVIEYKERYLTPIEAAGFTSEDWESSYYLDDNQQEVALGSHDACITYILNQLLGDETTLADNMTAFIVGRSYGRDARYTIPVDADTLDTVIDAAIPGGYIKGFNGPGLIVGGDMSVWGPNGDKNYSFPIVAFATSCRVLELKSDYSLGFDGPVTLPATLKTETRDQYYVYYWRSYANSYSLADLVGGISELHGQMRKDDRNGYLRAVTLSNNVNAYYQQTEIKTLWWDESNVLPVGSVSVSYKDSNANDGLANASVQIGNGQSSYDMSENYYLTKFPQTLSNISALLNGDFKTATAALTWTPTDAVTIGCPWIEAGDLLAFSVAGPWVIVRAPVLRRELAGIQTLTDTITSVAGQITGVDNG